MPSRSGKRKLVRVYHQIQPVLATFQIRGRWSRFARVDGVLKAHISARLISFRQGISIALTG
jgi:hypothetical protein